MSLSSHHVENDMIAFASSYHVHNIFFSFFRIPACNAFFSFFVSIHPRFSMIFWHSPGPLSAGSFSYQCSNFFPVTRLDVNIFHFLVYRWVCGWLVSFRQHTTVYLKIINRIVLRTVINKHSEFHVSVCLFASFPILRDACFHFSLCFLYLATCLCR